MKQLGYIVVDIYEVLFYVIGVGVICEVGKVKVGQIVVIGFVIGIFGGISFDIVFFLGVNVIVLGCNEEKFKWLVKQFGNYECFSYVVMIGDDEVDVVVI